jgi:hypothetical protein
VTSPAGLVVDAAAGVQVVTRVSLSSVRYRTVPLEAHRWHRPCQGVSG